MLWGCTDLTVCVVQGLNIHCINFSIDMGLICFSEGYENYICHKSSMVMDGACASLHVFIKGPSSVFPARGRGSWAMSLPAVWGEGVKPFGEGTAVVLDTTLLDLPDSLLLGPGP